MNSISVLAGFFAALIFLLASVNEQDYIVLAIKTIVVFIAFMAASKALTFILSKILMNNIENEKESARQGIDITLGKETPGVETAQNTGREKAEEIIGEGLFGMLSGQDVNAPSSGQGNDSFNFEPLGESVPRVEENQ